MTLQMFAEATATGRAVLSEDGRYRYTLERAWAAIPRYVLWIMLNPSTADASKNDATVRRCLGYAHGWGYTGILVGNLYAFRATDPLDLRRQAARGVDVVGPENPRHIVGLLRRASCVVCAWGQVGPRRQARADMLAAIQFQHAPLVLKVNGNGQPAHPLMLRADLNARPWDPCEQQACLDRG